MGRNVHWERVPLLDQDQQSGNHPLLKEPRAVTYVDIPCATDGCEAQLRVHTRLGASTPTREELETIGRPSSIDAAVRCAQGHSARHQEGLRMMCCSIQTGGLTAAFRRRFVSQCCVSWVESACTLALRCYPQKKLATNFGLANMLHGKPLQRFRPLIFHRIVAKSRFFRAL